MEGEESDRYSEYALSPPPMGDEMPSRSGPGFRTIRGTDADEMISALRAQLASESDVRASLSGGWTAGANLDEDLRVLNDFLGTTFSAASSTKVCLASTTL